MEAFLPWGLWLPNQHCSKLLRQKEKFCKWVIEFKSGRIHFHPMIPWFMCSGSRREHHIIDSDPKRVMYPVRHNLIVLRCCLPTGTTTESSLNHSNFQLGQWLLGDGACGKTSWFNMHKPTAVFPLLWNDLLDEKQCCTEYQDNRESIRMHKYGRPEDRSIFRTDVYSSEDESLPPWKMSNVINLPPGGWLVRNGSGAIWGAVMLAKSGLGKGSLCSWIHT